MKDSKLMAFLVLVAISCLYRFRMLPKIEIEERYGQQSGQQQHPSFLAPSAFEGAQAKNERRTFTIVILTMNRLHSLQRLVQSLMHPDCRYGDFDMAVNLEFHIDRPRKGADAAWWDTVRWTANATWPHGSVRSLVARENMGLRGSWFRAWRPASDRDRAIILEDDVEVSPPWFRWLNGAHDAYARNENVAGFSLQRQDLVPLKDKRRSQSEVPSNDNEPFLYSLPGSIGFAPNAKVWRRFLEWTECALCNNVNVFVEGLVTSDWWNRLDKRSMWTQHLVYYMYHNDLYCVYQFPKNNAQALSLHWKEKGEHFDGKDATTSHEKVLDPIGLGNFTFPKNPRKYDWGANIVTSSPPKTLLLSADVGYDDLSLSSTFLSSLRKYYKGDALLLEEGANDEIKKMLGEHNVMHEMVKSSKGWHQVNIDRFRFYSTYCRNYDYCMALDFRDSFFQDNPFKFLNIESEADLILQAYSIRFGQKVKGIPEHWKMIPTCAGFNETLAEEYRSCLTGKPLINAGGIIGKGNAFKQLESFVIGMAKEGCSDQMAVNIGVYCELLANVSSVKVSEQGTGTINMLGYGSQYMKLGSKIGNLDCLPSPVVHQWELVDLKGPAPLGGMCAVPGEFKKQALPDQGYILVPVTNPLQSSEEATFQPAQELIAPQHETGAVNNVP